MFLFAGNHRVGADLAYVLTAEEAALPIKCYGPELMVIPIYSVKVISKFSVWSGLVVVNSSLAAAPRVSSFCVQAFDAAAAADDAAAVATAAGSSPSSNSSSSSSSQVDLLVAAAVDAACAVIVGRVHGVLLGPGLGRHPAVLRVAAAVVQRLGRALGVWG